MWLSMLVKMFFFTKYSTPLIQSLCSSRETCTSLERQGWGWEWVTYYIRLLPLTESPDITGGKISGEPTWRKISLNYFPVRSLNINLQLNHFHLPTGGVCLLQLCVRGEGGVMWHPLEPEADILPATRFRRPKMTDLTISWESMWTGSTFILTCPGNRSTQTSVREQ